MAAAEQQPCSSQAKDTIKAAFEDFEKIVTPKDKIEFQSTELGHVRQAALQVERQLAARQCFRNMGRLQPLFDGLEHYSKAIEVLCNGTPYLPWIWAPVKLALLVTSDYIGAFEKLIAAYAQIAEALPRFDKFNEAFKDDTNFQQVLAIFYADILKFHKKAYKFTKREGWKRFFDSSWGRFNRRFQSIISDLHRHAELVDKEAIAAAIVQARRERAKALEQVIAEEREQTSRRYQAVLSWLNVKEEAQEDRLADLANSCSPGSCDWILKHRVIASWLKRQEEQKFIWLNAKPGCGKSVMVSRLVQFLKSDPGCTVLFHFADRLSSSEATLTSILRSLIAQLIRKNSELITFVFANYVLDRKVASVYELNDLLPNLLRSASSKPTSTVDIRIVLDGLDECRHEEQKSIAESLFRIGSFTDSKHIFKVIASSRDTHELSKIFRKRPAVCLDNEKDAMRTAIGSFVGNSFLEIRDDLPFSMDDSSIAEIEKMIVDKSEGMFLWAKLVLEVLRYETFDAASMKAAVASLPEGLHEFYDRIISHLQRKLSSTSFERVRRIFSWLAYARRPLRQFELRVALTLHTANTNLVAEQIPPSAVFELCKPLVEIRGHESISFVHSSVKAYICDAASGPFLDQRLVQHDLTLACVAALNNNMSILDENTTDDERYKRMVAGLHGLHLYAHEHWADHLLSYLNQGGNLSDADSESPGMTISPRHFPPSTIVSLEILRPYEYIYDAVRKFLFLRLQIQSMSSGSEMAPLEEGTSILNESLATFQGALRYLLALDSVAGVPQEAFLKFKKDYGSAAFPCSVMGCAYASIGFESEASLRKHQNIFHRKMLWCTETGCKWDLPFTSESALKQHEQKEHMSRPASTVPPSLGRKTRNQRIHTPPIGGFFLGRENYSHLACACLFDSPQAKLLRCASCNAGHRDNCSQGHGEVIRKNSMCISCFSEHNLGNAIYRQQLQLIARMRRMPQREQGKNSASGEAPSPSSHPEMAHGIGPSNNAKVNLTPNGASKDDSIIDFGNNASDFGRGNLQTMNLESNSSAPTKRKSPHPEVRKQIDTHSLLHFPQRSAAEILSSGASYVGPPNPYRPRLSSNTAPLRRQQSPQGREKGLENGPWTVENFHGQISDGVPVHEQTRDFALYGPDVKNQHVLFENDVPTRRESSTSTLNIYGNTGPSLAPRLINPPESPKEYTDFLFQPERRTPTPPLGLSYRPNYRV